MIALIFEQLDGEKIMLPILETAFEEKKNADGVYVMAYFNNDRFNLKTSLMEIQRMCQMSAQPPMHVPLELKNLRGFSGV